MAIFLRRLGQFVQLGNSVAIEQHKPRGRRNRETQPHDGHSWLWQEFRSCLLLAKLIWQSRIPGRSWRVASGIATNVCLQDLTLLLFSTQSVQLVDTFPLIVAIFNRRKKM